MKRSSTWRVATAVDILPDLKYLRSSSRVCRETSARTGVDRLNIAIAARRPSEESCRLALSSANRYDRLTGYISARALALAARGVEGLIVNGGRMRLIVGCTLPEEEVAAIERGFDYFKASANRVSASIKAGDHDYYLHVVELHNTGPTTAMTLAAFAALCSGVFGKPIQSRW
jgi:hypothetical protein